MATNVQITKDTISGGLARLKAELGTEKQMYFLCETARGLIITRTLAGKDENGAVFEPYSTERYYAPIDDAYRPEGYPKPAGGRSTALRGGRKLKTMAFDEGGYEQYKTGIGRPSFPQLSVSGQMLADIAITVLNQWEGELFFASRASAAKAHGHHTGANYLPMRPFFGLTEGNIGEMVSHLVQYLKNNVKQAGLA